MKFEAEIDLVNVLTKSLKKIFNDERIEIFEEVSLGYGIADVVVSNFTKPKSFLKSSKINLNSCDINILRLVQVYKQVKLEQLTEITKVSNKKTEESLDKLLKNKYLKTEQDQYSINKEYEFPFKNNFAIEAKLKDWKRALKQAYRYKWFAEYVFVVLDTHYSKTAIKNIDEFIKHNVGLASISPDGDIIRHYVPKYQRPFDPKMRIQFSEQIKQNYALAR